MKDVFHFEGCYLHPLFAGQNEPFCPPLLFICHFILGYTWLQTSHQRFRLMEVGQFSHSYAAYSIVYAPISASRLTFSIRRSMYLNRSNWFSAICLLTELCFVPPCSPRHATVTITPVSRRHVIIMQISRCCFCIWFAVTAARPTTGC